jgi:hypothetical protein
VGSEAGRSVGRGARARLATVVLVVTALAACADGAANDAARVRPLDLSGGFDPPVEDAGGPDDDAEPTLLTETRISPLPPGTYTTDTLGVPLTFTVGDGWHLVANFDRAVQLSPVATAAFVPDAPLLAFLAVEGSTLLGGLWADGDDGLPVPDSARAFASWFARNQWVDARDVTPVEVGGLRGFEVAYEVRELPDDRATEPSGSEVVFILGPRDKAWFLAEGSAGSLTLLDSPRGVLMSEMSSSEPDVEFFSRAQEVRGSMRFRVTR